MGTEKIWISSHPKQQRYKYKGRLIRLGAKLVVNSADLAPNLCRPSAFSSLVLFCPLQLVSAPLSSLCSPLSLVTLLRSPTLPRLTSGAAQPSSSSSSAGPKSDVITLSSSDDAPRVTSAAAGSKPDIITLSTSSDDKQEASSWKGSSSAGSKDGPLVLTSSDSDSDGQLLLLAKRQKRRPPRNVAWVFSDEVKILTALADERLKSGRLPRSWSALLDAIRSRAHLKRQNPTAGDVARKVHNLKDRFKKVIASGGAPSGGLRDRNLYELSAKVWPELLPRIVHNSSSSSSSSD